MRMKEAVSHTPLSLYTYKHTPTLLKMAYSFVFLNFLSLRKKESFIESCLERVGSVLGINSFCLLIHRVSSKQGLRVYTVYVAWHQM